MKIMATNKIELVLHGVPTCAICNKPVERMESWYDINCYSKRFRVYCHGDMEEAALDDMLICSVDSVRFGQAFIDKLPQPQLESK
jgi:hypothetical protein